MHRRDRCSPESHCRPCHWIWSSRCGSRHWRCCWRRWRCWWRRWRCCWIYWPTLLVPGTNERVHWSMWSPVDSYQGGTTLLRSSTITHGEKLMSYPSLWCHIFLRSANEFKDPVDEARWDRLNNLKGHSLFLGINYPFFLLPSPIDAEATEPVFQLFKPTCVFATHSSVRDLFPQPIPSWSRMLVNGGPAIGSRLQYKKEKIEHRAEAPMWFVPTLPPVFPWEIRDGWWPYFIEKT